jgi:hypothetical protein
MEHFVDMMRYWNWDYWKLLMFIAAIGAVSMAILQLINELTPFRSIYHAYLLREWIAERLALYEEGLKSSPAPAPAPKADVNIAFTQLIAQATGGHSRPLLGLAPAQLVAQINAAAQGALDDAQANFALIVALSQPTSAQIPLILKRAAIAPSESGHIEDLAILYETPSAAMLSEDSLKRYMEARNRIVHRIQRNLDGMQITFGSNSAWLNQVLAILISIALCYLIVARTREPGHSYFLSLLLLGVFAGYVAPIFGDIVNAIRKLGKA